MKIKKNKFLAMVLLILVGSTTSITSKQATKKAELSLAIVYGSIIENPTTFTDKRDGHVYRQIKIGNQVWMAENLNYGKLVLNMQQSNNTVPEKSYYKNDSVLGKKFGALYTWEEAVQYKNAAGITQGLCPDGWHLPSDSEWNTLCRHLDKSINDKTDGWQGETIGIVLIDSLKHKFNVKFCGNAVSHWWFYLNEMAYFWTATPHSNASARYKALAKQSNKIYSGYGDVQIGMNIRCIKD
jgi:uncharacterized protein (TIGR02145 family)